jgi:hypothetical protein
MKVVMDRGLCDASLPFCQRCSAAFIRNPEGEDRPCILDIQDDGSDLLTIELLTDRRVLTVELSEEMRELAGVEGWEVLGDFDPALFRTGAIDRWHQIRELPTTH